ncbi:hypothetical protein C2G38_2205454 [Gigaspora rosea]|uniref:Uncharacterized protein n=1 Tax=Gigaspora rosea TaxID=44941 RepID=A0A397UMH0_9GLOM|nr:hypothetical protein C2G38_2205454 [Gigaspora rosea]
MKAEVHIVETETAQEFSAETVIRILQHVGPTVDDIIKEINEIYKNAEINKEVCLIMANRAYSASQAIIIMKERITRNEEKLKNFRTETYRLALQRLEKVIRDIKDYTYKVSKLNRFFIRFFSAKYEYEDVIEKYDLCMKNLQVILRVNNAFYRAKDKTEETKKVEKALEKTEKV